MGLQGGLNPHTAHRNDRSSTTATRGIASRAASKPAAPSWQCNIHTNHSYLQIQYNSYQDTNYILCRNRRKTILKFVWKPKDPECRQKEQSWTMKVSKHKTHYEAIITE
jgi:hypothetical protein